MAGDAGKETIESISAEITGSLLFLFLTYPSLL
jgi:hypothetical protein